MALCRLPMYLFGSIIVLIQIQNVFSVVPLFPSSRSYSLLLLYFILFQFLSSLIYSLFHVASVGDRSRRYEKASSSLRGTITVSPHIFFYSIIAFCASFSLNSHFSLCPPSSSTVFHSTLTSLIYSMLLIMI